MRRMPSDRAHALAGRGGWPLRALLAAQAIAAAGVLWRLVRGRGGECIRAERTARHSRAAVSVLVPVLNEARRLRPCIAGLLEQDDVVREVLVVDGGSTDGTAEMVGELVDGSPRLRLVRAGPAPATWNGKVWGLHAGEQAADPASDWLLTVDADVRVTPPLALALVAHAERHGLAALSVTTSQRLSGPAEAALHPALLATLVYRFGSPGHATTDPARVQANGQCMLLRRDVLERVGGFAAVRDSLCEDVTLARRLAEAGVAVGFFEAPGLVDVRMFSGWRDAWRNWPRSLTLRDRTPTGRGWSGLVTVALAQALPGPLLLLGGRRLPWSLLMVNRLLLLVRLGILAGTHRAYPGVPPTYWLAPLFDLPAVAAIWASALRRHHTWRGRSYDARILEGALA